MRTLFQPENPDRIGLAGLAERDAGDHDHAVADFGRAKRDVAREQPLVHLAERSSAQLEALCAAELTSPSQVAQRAEELLRVANALGDLPDEQRSAVLAYYWRGASVRDIAAEMQRSDAAVAGLIYRGVKRLNERLAPVG